MPIKYPPPPPVSVSLAISGFLSTFGKSPGYGITQGHYSDNRLRGRDRARKNVNKHNNCNDKTNFFATFTLITLLSLY
jgi:hypothetical protein